MSEERLPYKNLGNFLKKKREHIHESLAEVSGAVEIDIDTLAKIETGELLPSEDILALLISYLDIEGVEAQKLLEWAGYDVANTSQSPLNEDQLARQILAIIPIDTRVIHVDKSEVQVGENGLTINFLQQNLNNQYSATARVGLSREHAQKLIELLSAGLRQKPAAQKLLPQPKAKKQKK